MEYMRYSRLSKDIEMEQEKRKGEYGGRFGRVKSESYGEKVREAGGGVPKLSLKRLFLICGVL